MAVVGPPGHAVENSIGIAAPTETVFDYVTDVRREREWNPQLREAEKLTPGPGGAGTRYRVRFGRGVGVAIIENTGFDRPGGWSAVSTSRRLDVRFPGPGHRGAGRVPVGGAERVVLARRAACIVPVLRRLMRRSWDQDLRAIKAIMEH